MKTKKCNKCGEVKEIKDFHPKRQKNKNKKGVVIYCHTFESSCKICKNKRNKYNNTRTPEIIEKIRVYQKEYHKNY